MRKHFNLMIETDKLRLVMAVVRGEKVENLSVPFRIKASILSVYKNLIPSSVQIIRQLSD